MRVRPGRLLAGVILGFAAAAVTAQQEALPEPLSLAEALRLAHPNVPAVELALAERDASEAALGEAEAITGVRLDAVARVRAIRPSNVSEDRSNNDSSASLVLRKRLYDFGYSDARQEAARAAGDGSEWRLLDARQKAHLAVMRRFFDVLLADLRFARDNEAMAGAFIDADRARDRHELKKISDIELLRLEAAYQEALQVRMRSQAQQRAARSHLAIAMGRPNELVSTLVRPPAPEYAAPPPDYDQLLATVMQENPRLKALRAEADAAQAAVEAARAGHGPVLSGEIDASAYNRRTSSTDPLGASLILQVPLLSGGAKDAAVASARAELRNRQAQLAAAKHELRQELLDLWLYLDDLRVQLDGLKVRGDYRELYLDRSRALYDLEVKTDLGDAMTEISAVRLDVAQAEFEWMMTQARLAAMRGQLLIEEQTE